jgi:zinc transport system ATP-binding protein
MQAIDVTHLSVQLGKSDILRDVSFAVASGEFVCITGPNGAGKTTLLKSLLGIIPAERGEMSFFGEPSTAMASRSKIGYLPQKNLSINPLFPASSEEVVLVGLMADRSFPKRVRPDDRATAREALALLGAEDLAERAFSELSGGQQQRVLLARALVNRPELLLLDEPSTALDPESREEFFGLLKALNREQGITVVIVTHDMDYVGRYASKILVIDRSVVYFGEAESFLHTHHITHHHDYA